MAPVRLTTRVIALKIIFVEWIVATINKEKLLSKEKLKVAFQMFDRDGSGAISSEEVKEILSQG